MGSGLKPSFFLTQEYIVLRGSIVRILAVLPKPLQQAMGIAFGWECLLGWGHVRHLAKTLCMLMARR